MFENNKYYVTPQVKLFHKVAYGIRSHTYFNAIYQIYDLLYIILLVKTSQKSRK